MHLNAITLGYAVPQGAFNGHIHSAFRSAVYLRLQDDWDLLTLVARAESDLPRGIRVNTPQGFSFEALRSGEAVACRNGTLRFPTAAIEVALGSARRWDCDLSAFAFDWTNPAVSRAWQLVWRILNDRQMAYGAQMVGENLLRPQENQGSLTIRRLVDGTAQLLAATAAYDADAGTAVAKLIGLGQGVTPTGDDLLVGYVAGLHCTVGRDPRRREYVSHLGRTMIDLGAETSDVSRSFLCHAALGHVSSRLAGLADAICTGTDSGGLIEIAEAAMRLGHTSGMDAVTGLLLGLGAWDGQLPN